MLAEIASAQGGPGLLRPLVSISAWGATTSHSDADDHDRVIKQTSPCLVPFKMLIVALQAASVPAMSKAELANQLVSVSPQKLAFDLSQSDLVSFFDFEKSGNALFVQEFKSIWQKAGNVFRRVCIQEKHIIELEIPVDQKRTIFQFR